MQNTVNALIGLAILGFVLAVISSLMGPIIMGLPAETFSRASANLALIAIALVVCCPKRSSES